ncbi:MAG TPA: four helix bundle protein [Balneolales bacterium]|nr:four helix bundle protein [Balneolales bacterium]
MHEYKNLKVWNKALTLATDVYKVNNSYPSEERYGLCSQIRRSVVSISSNIAEGAGRGTDLAFKHFLNIAYGSAYELETQFIISNNLIYLDSDVFKESLVKIEEIEKMLYALIQKLSKVKYAGDS